MSGSQEEQRSWQRRYPVRTVAPASRQERERSASGGAPPVIEFRSVSKRYEGGELGLLRATFTVSRGEFVFLVGPTGSGKSTVMRLLTKEIDPTRGSICVAGRDLSAITTSRLASYRRNIGVVFEDSELPPSLTVYDNLAYPLHAAGGSRSEIRAAVPELLRLTGLSRKLHNYPDELSSGERQRVSIAKAFVNHPPLLLADEPTENLEPETSIDIMRLLYRINRAGTTVLVATRDQAMVGKLRRRVLALSRGLIVRDDAAGRYTRDESTREFARRMRAPSARPPGV
jgi:cell division transport system ATP-binding protein